MVKNSILRETSSLLDSGPTPARVAMEAAVIGVAFVVIFFALHAASMSVLGKARAMTHGSLAIQIAVAAALFHIVCEYSGLNRWYCQNYE